MSSADPTLTGTRVLNGADPSLAKGFINHEQMRIHQESGAVTPLSRDITDHVRFNGRWWIGDRNGWHLITDQQLADLLDTQRRWVEADVYLGGSAV